jgi:hypothetical protein
MQQRLMLRRRTMRRRQRRHRLHAIALAWVPCSCARMEVISPVVPQRLGRSACHDHAHKTYAANRDSLSSDSELLLLPCL